MKPIWIGLLIIAFASCKQVYDAPVNAVAPNYLVVDGFINNDTPGITTIYLSRTTQLSDTANFTSEQHAQVSIESDANDIFPLNEITAGTYTSEPIVLNPLEKYRLHIRTSDGKEYLSDSVAVKKTPDIDSISWLVQNNGVQIYINTHDPDIQYYQWRYEETWEFHAKYQSSLVYTINPQTHAVTGVEPFDTVSGSYNDKLYTCWKADTSTGIILGSTEKLTDNQIYLPLNFIPGADWRLSVLYSIKVRQFALSKEAYQFLEIMKKNTEQLGSIFDAQPSALKGNIHCLTRPDELVVGFVEVSQEKDARIFIQNEQIPGWNYSQDCPLPLTIENNADSIAKKAGNLYPTNVVEHDMSGAIVTFGAAEHFCVDCTLRGTNNKPSFWP